MREDVLSLRAMGGDPVSEEYLKADLYHRAEALKDIPDTPLFFGRLDYAATRTPRDDGVAGHSFHIGRRHVHAPDGTPAVIDWRAPVSRPFYRASAADPMNLALRRRFGFSGGELTAYEDELFTGAGRRCRVAGPDRRTRPEPGRAGSSSTRSSGRGPGPMRDIVATIQPDQDDIVRAGADADGLRAGRARAPGRPPSGCTGSRTCCTRTGSRSGGAGVVMVGPNRAFLSYIRNVLPALGELDVTQTTVGELVGAGCGPVRGTDAEAAAIVKGDARMAEVLRRALWASVRRPAAAGGAAARLAALAGGRLGAGGARRTSCGTGACGTARPASCWSTGSRT